MNSAEFEISFMCPQCHQHTVIDDDRIAISYDDVENNDYMQCTNCGAGYYAFRTEYGLKLLNIEEHEFDNDPEGFAKPESTTESEDRRAFSSTVLGGTSMKYGTLVSKLTAITKSFVADALAMPEDEVVDYFTVDVSPSTDGEYYDIEVRAELSYDDMLALSQELDPIIEEVYPDACFGFDSPGILVATAPVTAIQASVVTGNLTDYGGAFDIDPYAFWTREDLDALGEDVEQYANDSLRRRGWGDAQLMLSGAYLEDDYKTITLEFEDSDGYTYAISRVIDMRKIRKPADLISKYMMEYSNSLATEYEENHNEGEFDV